MQYWWGEDTFGARQALGELATQEKATLAFVDKYDVAASSLAHHVAQSSSLFGKRLTVLLDVSTWPKALQEEVLTAASQALVWDRITKKDSLVFKQFKKQARQFPGWDRGALTRWLREEAKKAGGEVEPAAAELLVDRLGTDRYMLKSELEKLLLTDQKITTGLVQDSGMAKAATTIFAAIEAVAGKQEQRAIGFIKMLLEAGENELYIVTMLAYQFRLLFLVRSGQEKGKSAELVAQEAGLKPYSVQKSWPLAARFSSSQLLDSLTKILATDFAIKQGKVDQITGVVMLVAGLTKAY